MWPDSLETTVAEAARLVDRAQQTRDLTARLQILASARRSLSGLTGHEPSVRDAVSMLRRAEQYPAEATRYLLAASIALRQMTCPVAG